MCNQKNREIILLPKTVWLAIIFLLLLFSAPVAFGGAFPLPLRHPDDGENLRNCLDCHDRQESEFPFARFSHTLFFAGRHASTARGYGAVCAMCHRENFCSDCHGMRPGAKPSLKNHGDPRRRMPHRGDYLTRHRIDGRIDPTACFRCHGRPKTAARCSRCHK